MAAALIAPAAASAGVFSYDEDTNTTDPAGYGNAPGQPQNQSSSDPCKWTVKGRLYVRNPTLDGIADGDPLPGVEIKVSGADWLGTVGNVFGRWDTVHTNANGEFTVTHTECDQRRVRVEAKFESASGDLRVLGSSSPEWYVLKDTGELQLPGTIDLQGEPFGGETGDQATGQARTDAQDWLLYRRAIDYVTSLGHSFLNPVTLNNPASLHDGDNSWTDPVFHGIHIAPANTNSRWNMLHELGHAFAYPREQGEDCLVFGALGTDTTHGASEKPCVAFNEGFANFFASKLDEELTGAGLIAPRDPSSSDPRSRAYLVSKGVLNLDDASHSDLGFDQAFRILTQADITRDLLGDGLGPAKWATDYAGASCAGRGVPSGLSGLGSALKVLGDANDQFDLRDADRPTITQFFNRADDRLSAFDASDATAYRKLVDPANDTEPHTLYGC
ncbi:hypothetical protein [Solirubrobacter ginsenosidimutans]|uniref:hypothetical protein n=1 Tax=Solirubrobacter ginsenosidimutans TaxID=490573 RepID=UPI0022CDCFB5|nr:hypothetical protein [Solirubrobacter ginsenosidimutans]